MVLGNRYYGTSFPVNPTRVEVGKPISTFRGYHFEGVYQTGATDGTPGHAKYKDLNGDGKISHQEFDVTGDGFTDLNPFAFWTFGTGGLTANSPLTYADISGFFDADLMALTNVQ